MDMAAYTPIARLRSLPSRKVTAISDSDVGAAKAPPMPCGGRAASTHAPLWPRPPTSQPPPQQRSPGARARGAVAAARRLAGTRRRAERRALARCWPHLKVCWPHLKVWQTRCSPLPGCSTFTPALVSPRPSSGAAKRLSYSTNSWLCQDRSAESNYEGRVGVLVGVDIDITPSLREFLGPPPSLSPPSLP